MPCPGKRAERLGRRPGRRDSAPPATRTQGPTRGERRGAGNGLPRARCRRRVSRSWDRSASLAASEAASKALGPPASRRRAQRPAKRPPPTAGREADVAGGRRKRFPSRRSLVLACRWQGRTRGKREPLFGSRKGLFLGRRKGRFPGLPLPPLLGRFSADEKAAFRPMKWLPFLAPFRARCRGPGSRPRPDKATPPKLGRRAREGTAANGNEALPPEGVGTRREQARPPPPPPPAGGRCGGRVEDPLRTARTGLRRRCGHEGAVVMAPPPT